MTHQALQTLLPPNTPQSTGKAIDLLRTLYHFQNLCQKNGNEFLAMMMPALEVFTLRDGFPLLHQPHRYVLVCGDLRAQKIGQEWNQEVEPGKLIEPYEQRDTRFVARGDCGMVRIKKGVAGNLLEKKLSQKERQCSKELRQYATAVARGEYPANQMLAKMPFFRCLGEYDMLELCAKSQVRVYSQGATTHQARESVPKIGCLVSGKVRCTVGESALSKLQRQRDNRGMNWVLTEGEWIGLEEYLWERPLGSNGVVSSMAAIIVWIPRDLFQSKFNLRVNYEALSRLSSLVQTKKLLFDKSLASRRQKQHQIAEQLRIKGMSPELERKLQTLQPHESQKKRKSTFRSAKSQKSGIDVPVLHRVNEYGGQGKLSLPHIEDHMNLFPAEYQSSPVDCNLKKELHRLNQNMKEKHTKGLPPMGSTETLSRTLFDKMHAMRLRGFSQAYMKPRQTQRQRQQIHFNRSIANNFRVHAGEHQTTLVPKSKSSSATKTLTIMDPQRFRPY